MLTNHFLQLLLYFKSLTWKKRLGGKTNKNLTWIDKSGYSPQEYFVCFNVIKSGNESFHHTSMFCRGTGSSTCSSRWQGFERIQPLSFWRQWSAAGLRGTPPRTRLSGNTEWQILLSLFLLYVAPTKRFFIKTQMEKH